MKVRFAFIWVSSRLVSNISHTGGMMSFRQSLSRGLKGIGQAAQEGAAALKLEAEVAAAVSRFNSAWNELQDRYPIEEADHAEVRLLLAQKKTGVTSKNTANIAAATARLLAITKKSSA